MGEYATYNGESVKIGTCESMYYLRFDQRGKVDAERNSINPSDPDILGRIRFRFPWPDEDDNRPGEFEDYNRSCAVYGMTAPETLEHYSVQFVAQAGYNVCLPCPESKAEKPFKIHRNGFGGAVKLTMQAVRGGVLAPVFECGGCGAAWSCPDSEDVKLALEWLEQEANRRGTDGKPERWYLEIAKRIRDGYSMRFPMEVRT
jgi:hypothetical protein